VGEPGPELINVSRGSQIVPNDIARQMGRRVHANYASAVSINGNADAVTMTQLQNVLAK
jgi:hypothetical protein